MRQDEQPSTAVARGDGTQAVDRAMRILEFVAREPSRASEISRELGLKWATTHRLLDYLTERGYLERDAPSGIYRPGLTLFQLGSQYLAGQSLLTIAHPILRELVEETGETGNIGVRNGERCITVDRYDSPLPVSATIEVGAVLPLTCGAKSLVLLAFSPDETIESVLSKPLPRLAAGSIVDPRQLRTRLATVRRAGFAVTDSDVNDSVKAIAAPIYDRRGQVVAALAIVAPRERLAAETLSRRVQSVVEHAARISARLGAPLD